MKLFGLIYAVVGSHSNGMFEDLLENYDSHRENKYIMNHGGDRGTSEDNSASLIYNK